MSETRDITTLTSQHYTPLSKFLATCLAGNDNGLLFHMTQPTSRSTIKSHRIK